MNTHTGDGDGLRRVTGWLFVVGAIAFAVAATTLSSTFDWPDILREPPDVVLPAFVAGGTSLVWTWFATAWTYAILLVPILLLPAALGRRDDPVLRAATFVGAASVLLSLIGFLRWVFVVPPLADAYVTGDPTTKAAVAAAWTAQHQFGGALLGEHLGQLLAIGWSITISVLILRTRMLPRWAGWAGLIASGLYLAQPGRHPRHRRPRLPRLGPRRTPRQFPVGPLGARTGRRRTATSEPPPHNPAGTDPGTRRPGRTRS